MKAQPEEAPEKTQGSGRPRCPTTAVGLGNRGAEVSQHLEGLCSPLQPVSSMTSKSRSHQKPVTMSGRVTGVPTTVMAGCCGGLRDAGFGSGLGQAPIEHLLGDGPVLSLCPLGMAEQQLVSFAERGKAPS